MSGRTRAAQRLVTAYCRVSLGWPAAGRLSAMKPAVSSRSSSMAWASPVICWPSTASRSTRPIVCAFRSAMLT